MKKALAICMVLVLAEQPGWAQRSLVAPWSNPDPNNPSPAYRPEPILFVHGVNANDGGWGTVIQTLQPYMAVYQEPMALPEQTVGGTVMTRTTQYPFLHTFNYGDPPGSNAFNRQTFDPVMWNAWDADLHGTAATNRFHSPQTWGPLTGDNRKTLNTRIDDIRNSYTVPGIATQQIVMVAHSLGALLSHYYLLEKPTDHGVRRLVTLAGAHQGSLLANWLTWYRAYGASDQSFDGHKVPWSVEHLYRWRGPERDTLHGIFQYWNLGSVQNAVMLSTQGAFVFKPRNPFLEYFWSTPAPMTEYVFNAYQMSLVPGATPYQDLRTLVDDAGVDEVFLRGDGFVPTRSALGKDGANSPSIWNGSTNINPNIHSIDPVLFGVWPNTDHTGATTNITSIVNSLLGVPYRWPGTSSNNWPSYAQMYGENQSFSKSFNTPSSGSTGYTDEPGIADLKLLYDRGGGNPLLIPAFNTWTTSSNGCQKTLTNATDFVGHQIIASGANNVRYVGAAGTKNHSQNPVGTSGTNYWVTAGNEYLPASLSVQANNGIAPITVATNVTGLGGAIQMVTNCLAQLDGGGAPQYQYGYFESSSSITANTNNYVAAQGYNLANLITPQAERAFNSPVDSATLVAILQKINAGEALSNACHNAGTIARWSAQVNEWVSTPTNGVFVLDFFPTANPTGSGIIHDAWTGTAYTNWTYSVANKQMTLTDAANAPSQLLVSYGAYLGCSNSFTTNYGGGTSFTVPALTNSALAGVTMNEAWLTQIRSALAATLPKYKDTVDTATCTNWTLPTILAAAGNSTSNWAPVVNGLLSPQHFSELTNAVSLLTTEYGCACEVDCPTPFPCPTNAPPPGVTNWCYRLSGSGVTQCVAVGACATLLSCSDVLSWWAGYTQICQRNHKYNFAWEWRVPGTDEECCNEWGEIWHEVVSATTTGAIGVCDSQVYVRTCWHQFWEFWESCEWGCCKEYSPNPFLDEDVCSDYALDVAVWEAGYTVRVWYLDDGFSEVGSWSAPLGEWVDVEPTGCGGGVQFQFRVTSTW